MHTGFQTQNQNFGLPNHERLICNNLGRLPLRNCRSEIGYPNEGEPSVIFGRDFLVTRKSKVDFGVGEMRIDLFMLEEERDIDALLVELVETMDEVGSSNGELVKMGKLARTRATMKKLDKFMMDHARLEEFMMDHAMLMKESMCDPGNYVLPVCVNRTTQMSALADTWEVQSHGEGLMECNKKIEDRDGHGTPRFELESHLVDEVYYEDSRPRIGFEGLGGTSMMSSRKGLDGRGEGVSLEEGGEDYGFNSNDEDVVPKIVLIRARITSITVNGKNAYELKGKFLDDLHKNAFSGTNGEDAVEHIEYFLKIIDPIDLPNVNQDKLRVVVFPISLDPTNPEFENWLASKFVNYMTMDIFTKGVLWDYWKLGSDEIEQTDLEDTDHDDEQEIGKNCRIETNLFDYDTPLCENFKEFNYLLKIDPDILTKDIEDESMKMLNRIMKVGNVGTTLKLTTVIVMIIKMMKDMSYVHINDVSLVDGVFNGAFSGDREEDFVLEEGVRRRLEWKPWRYGGGEEKCGEDNEEHGEGDYLTRMNGIKEVNHESYGRRIQKWFSKMHKY
ncbi:hypothetical protein Tco_0212198 [Tanacetum coccineum]